MTTVTINGHTYTDDADPATGFANGGHRVRFVPALSDVVAVAAQVASNALVASNAAASAVTGASTSASSTTSLAIGTGSKSLTIETGKNIVIGMTVKIAVTADGTQWMAGDVTAYTSGTGALVVNVTTTQGSGTFAAWTVSLSGPPGAGIPSMTGNSGRFLSNNGTSANWSATIVEASGRIGIGRTPTTYKAEVEDSVNTTAGLAVFNAHTGSTAQAAVAVVSDSGTAYTFMQSAARGGLGGFTVQSSVGAEVGNIHAAGGLYLLAGNVHQVAVSPAGVVDFLAGRGGRRSASHQTFVEIGPITLQTGAAGYANVAHGGTRRPDWSELRGRIKVANNGWAVGDEVELQNARLNAVGVTHFKLTQLATPSYLSTAGVSVSASAANIDLYVRLGWD